MPSHFLIYSLQLSYKVYMMSLIFQMRTLSYSEIKQLAQRHTSSNCSQSYLLCKQNTAASKGSSWEERKEGPGPTF